MSQKIAKVGIIGCGRIGSLFDENNANSFAKTHAKAYTNSPDKFKITALYDIDNERLKSAQSFWNIDFATNQLSDFLKQDLDIVSVCSHVDSRSELLEALNNQKIKVIVCEKPLAQNLQESQAIKENINYSKVIINYIRRFDQLIIDLKNQIASHKFGDLQNVIGHYGKGLINNGSHLIDTLSFLIGDIKGLNKGKLLKDDRANSHDPTFNFSLLFNNGIEAQVLANNHNYFTHFEMDLLFEKARILITEGARRIDISLVEDDPDFAGYSRLKLSQSNTNGLQTCFKNITQEAYELWLNPDLMPSSSIDDSIQLFKLIQ